VVPGPALHKLAKAIQLGITPRVVIVIYRLPADDPWNNARLRTFASD
jgi:hypothetical protein